MKLFFILIGAGIAIYILLINMPLMTTGAATANASDNATFFYGFTDLMGSYPLLVFGVIGAMCLFGWMATRNRGAP